MIKLYEINKLLIPRTWIGWATFGFLSLLGSIVVREGFSYIGSYLDKWGWIEAKAIITDLEMPEDSRAFRLRYAYSVNAISFEGKSIGLEMKSSQSASPKLLNELRQYHRNGTAITIRYDPINPSGSYFDPNPNAIFYVAFLLVFPVLLFLLFLMASFLALKQYLESRVRESEGKGPWSK